MDPSQFVKYIADHPELKPSVTFEAWGFREAALQSLSSSFPRGQAFIFPDYFAFLTTRHFQGGMQLFEEGWQMSWQMFASYTKTALKIHKWAANHASIAVDIAKALGSSKYRDPEITLKALSNPGSFSFPLSDLTGLVARGGGDGRPRDRSGAGRPPYFQLITPGETYLVQMAPRMVPTPTAFVRNIRQMNNWQPRAFELLQEAVARNTAGR